MTDNKTPEWHTDKALVTHLLDEYGKQLKEMAKSMSELDKKLEVLNTKVMFGAALISIVISIISKFITFDGGVK